VGSSRPSISTGGNSPLKAPGLAEPVPGAPLCQPSPLRGEGVLWWEGVALLWPVGVALVMALGVAAIVPAAESRRVWIAFLTLGSALPAGLVLAMAIDPHRVSPSWLRAVRWLALLASAVALGAGIVHGLTYRSGAIAIELGAALVQAAAVVALTTLPRGSDEQPSGTIRIATAALWAAVSIGAWSVAGSLLWWQFPGGLRHPWVIAVFAVSAVIVFSALWRPDAIANRALGWAGTAAALAVLAVVSVRTNDLFDIHSMYTWEPFIGPAELVRQGGWLLWDVPAQYGYLNEYAIAWMPTASPWEGLFILNSVMCFLLAAAVFMLLRSLGRGLINLVMSGAVALVACFFRPGLGPTIIGPGGYPSTGGFRFLWCVALLLVLLSLLRVRSPRARRVILVLGNLVWVVGVLWSAESAIWSTIVWLPGYFLMVVAERWKEPDIRTRVLRIAGWTAIPVLFLAATIAIGFFIYQVGLGHTPDLQAFYDFGLAFQGGVVAYPIDPGGPGWVLFLVYMVTLVTLVWRVRKQPAVASVVLVGAAALIYATSSYFVGRSHPNNVWNLAPEICIALAITLVLAGRDIRGDPMPVLLRLVTAPLLVILLFGALGDHAAVVDWVTRPQRDITHIDAGLVRTDPNLQLLLAAHVQPGDRVAYIAEDTDPVLSPHLYADAVQPDGAPLWLPLVPFTAINILPANRRAAYLERFIARHPEGGWLIERTSTLGEGEWVRTILREHFTPGQTYANADYQLTLWSPV